MPPTSRGYATEKLYNSALSLADGEGDVKSRLYNAGFNLIARGRDLVPAEFEEWGEEYESIYDALIVREPRTDGDSRLDSTIAAMTSAEAVDLARRIFHLYGKLLHGSSL